MRDTKFRTRLFLCFLAVIVMTLVLPGLYVRKNIKEDGIDETVRNARREAVLIRMQMEELMQRRRDKQPLDMPSAGSVFKRPTGQFAGTLIEQCGLKGKHVGGAEVSRKHAGFVVNAGGATCADVLALIKKVQDTVFTATGVTLEPEVKIIR